MTKTITPAELALELEASPRTVRKFLRSDSGMGMKVGKGQRWAIEARQVRSLKAKFAKWNETAEEAPEAPDTAPEAD